MEFRYEQLDHVQLAAPKGAENQARAFYQDLLGFMEVEKPENLKQRGGVWFSDGNICIHIGIEDPFQPAKKAHPAFQVKNIEAMKKYLQIKQVDFMDDKNLPGANRFYLHDPFGNRLEFIEWI
ncbi:VOC family protein [Ornithinibacillus halotolerans]|uniref:Glyoxalase n=1 Tax=Ornithinibacillus halotolerans TaxID=1274357 RepID=A0A916S5H9_9BACI|nr:VOC family protein [Ornithinibacillus halotolerans]GGA85476.1 glyoxalase [Ornithinibacillus halotolerans]